MKKNKGGRPTKYKPEYCELLIEHMKSGLSFEAFAGVVGVWKDVLYDWVAKFPEFSDAKKLASSANLLTLEKIGHAGMVGKIPGFNLGAWCFKMKNMHGWRDRVEVDQVSSVININVDKEDLNL